MTIRISIYALADILEENYYALTTTGREALLNIRTDLEHGLFKETHKEWGTSDGDILEVLEFMEKEFYRDGKMDVQAGEWQSRKRQGLQEDVTIRRLASIANQIKAQKASAQE